ncbi:RidA family protein [Nisaea acidiphila]|uniref:RidA family protein n=1 Tax=Nisaea acidiphila TaxID=1862145 RepID=A0A9J7APK0_9PROT|nr:RidA family protein [Nisaea acidiphila]UUX48842.1 RidA family protein [Nisaea acidiphila]
MRKRAIVPPALRAAAEQLKMSPAILSGGHLFLTGSTGGNADGTMPGDAAIQMRNALGKIGAILAEAGVGFDAVVEMTTYHVGLREHFEAIDRVRLEHFSEPFPAWTAVEVAGLRRDGAVIEIRVIAEMDTSD